MIKFGKGVVKFRIPIIIISILLIIPALYGIANTRVNYDILSYLPEDIDTMKGQDILLKDFGKGGFSIIVIDGMSDKQVVKTEEKIKNVKGVADVIWYDSLTDITLPKEVLPDNVLNAFSKDDSTIMIAFFDDTTSADRTMNAIEEIKDKVGNQCFVSGMSAVVTDTKNLSNKETPVYVLIAVVLCSVILALFMDSFLAPVFFMIGIGLAIIYNLGSNIFLGEISYITKALASVLQLGVTMDYSIFLWHSYEENKQRFPDDKNRAMAHAISNTITSVVGSSTTTIAGFIALCFMSFTLGMNLGIVMAKGVLLGVISCVTILPAMILVFDKAISKTAHKPLMPEFKKLPGLITKRYAVFVILFVVILIPALYGYMHTGVYYNLDRTLPKDLDSIVANTKLDEKYHMSTTHMILVKPNIPSKEINNMLNEINSVDGTAFAFGMDSLIGNSIPQEVIPEHLTKTLKSNNWQLILVGSEYKIATDDVNKQIGKIQNIVKKYDNKGMVIGEAACTKDLINITDKDFKVVSIVSIGAIFILIALVLKSVSLPIILVGIIEFAIFINMGIPFYTGTKLPFIASIVIGTIQLGSTVDYAILMTTRYKKERYRGQDKQGAISTAVSTSVKSLIVSAFSFFAATFGVGFYSNIDMISSLCTLMARGALISVCVVLFMLPSMLMVFDKLICKTTIGMKNKDNANKSLERIC